MLSKYHWVRSHPDIKAKYINDHEGFKLGNPADIPNSIDLRKYASPIKNQGELGSCTGNAISSIIEYLENKDGIYKEEGTYSDLSRLFLYYLERVSENTINSDSGAQISDGIAVLVKYGVCTETLHPYNVSIFAQKPSDEAYKNAETRKIKHYARVPQTREGIRTALGSGYPFVFGFSVYSYFESQEMANTGVLRQPRFDENFCGGHAVAAYGIGKITDFGIEADLQGEFLVVRNSWGSDWGGPLKGWFLMPLEYAINPDLASDFWSVTC